MPKARLFGRLTDSATTTTTTTTTKGSASSTSSNSSRIHRARDFRDLSDVVYNCQWKFRAKRAAFMVSGHAPRSKDQRSDGVATSLAVRQTGSTSRCTSSRRSRPKALDEIRMVRMKLRPRKFDSSFSIVFWYADLNLDGRLRVYLGVV